MKYCLLTLFSLFFFISNAQQPFVTTWEVTGSDLSIHIPANHSDYTFDYSIDFGDGTILSNQTGVVNYTYNAPGTYTVSISGIFPHMIWVGWGDLEPYFYWADKLKTVEQWGDIQWLDMSFMFFECTNVVINATDTPDLSQVTNMEGMFFNAQSINADLSNWDFTTGNLYNFLDNTNMTSDNYDLLLNKLLQLNLNNGNLGAAGIKYCDVFARQQLIDNGWNIYDDGLADDCNFNYVSGYVLYDETSDGCNQNDTPISNHLVNVNNGTANTSIAINENGQYTIGLNAGSYTLSILNLDSNFTLTPVTQTINFSGQNEIIDDVDFCITANQQFDDLSIDIFPLEDAIPGFETDYQIIVTNNGTQTIPNYQVTFFYDEISQSFVSSTETGIGNIAPIITFDLTNLEPFSSKIFEITMLNAMPPTLNSGDVIGLSVQVTPDINDVSPDDNTANYDQTVVNSFDPNDKLVIQGDEVADENIDQYLDYRIRFQNIGTANALNVKITDTISDKLDWTTFQPISSSHDYRIEIVDGEEINYYFDNINLPFEDADPEGSNGYITYKIKPKSDVVIGDVIENTAYIYFDFNLPIITNTVTTTIVDNLSNTAFDKPQISVYPNPVHDKLFIKLPSGLQINGLKLFNINGQMLQGFEEQSVLDLSDLSQGVYILKVETDQGMFHKKVVKK